MGFYIHNMKKGSDGRMEETDTGINTGTYLPQVREKASGIDYMYSKDTVIKMQESVCRLPLPRDTADVSRLNLTSGYRMRALEETYGIVYPSDVNKINVEFSNDLVDAGYFTLKAGDTVTVTVSRALSEETFTASITLVELKNS